MLLALAIVLVALYATTLAGAIWFERGLPGMARDPLPGSDPEPPVVAILIPARDEEDDIGACVRTCLDQIDVNVRVLLIDDGSTDATVDRARAAASGDDRFRVLNAPPLEPGWFGKPAALAFGAREVVADWLLFVDADTRLGPSAARSAVDAAKRLGATLLSVWPRQETHGFWDGRLQPWIIGLSAVGNALLRLWNRPFPAALWAIGAFILVEEEAYHRVGGHGAVRSKVLEDVELAHAFRRAGEATVMLDGRKHVVVRMYSGFRDLLQGWSKNMKANLGDNAFFAALVSLYTLALAFGPTVVVLMGLRQAAPWAVALGVVAILLQLGLGRMFSERVEVAPWRKWLAAGPTGAILFTFVIGYSMSRAAGGRGVNWKGRRYPGEDLGAAKFDPPRVDES